MKSGKTLLIALAAGVTVAGILGFFLATETGKKFRGNIKNKGTKYAGKFEEMMKEAKQKWANEEKEVV